MTNVYWILIDDWFHAFDEPGKSRCGSHSATDMLDSRADTFGSPFCETCSDSVQFEGLESDSVVFMLDQVLGDGYGGLIIESDDVRPHVDKHVSTGLFRIVQLEDDDETLVDCIAYTERGIRWAKSRI